MQRFVVEDDVDAAFSMVRGDLPDGLVAEQVSEDEGVVAFPPNGAPRRGPVAAADLAPYSVVTPRSGSALKAAADDLFSSAGEPLHVALESGDPFLLRCLVSGGFGAAILPRSLTRREGPPIEVRSLKPRVLLPVMLLWREHRHFSPAARAFIAFARREAGG